MLYRDLLDKFVNMSKKIIGKNLTGVYLHGSMAMGCFHPEKSDIDLIVVIEKDMTDVQKTDFMNCVLELNGEAPPKGLELSVVKREYCNSFVYPTPYVLHFSVQHLKWFQDNPDEYIKNMKGTDKDLAAHFFIINKYGIMLYGKKIEDVFGEVPKACYIDSIWCDVKNAKKDIFVAPTYIILNLCRVLAFIEKDLCLSKQQGAVWGLKNLPEKYHCLIAEALKSYQSGGEIMINTEAADDFAQYMLLKIRNLKKTI